MPYTWSIGEGERFAPPQPGRTLAMTIQTAIAAEVVAPRAPKTARKAPKVAEITNLIVKGRSTNEGAKRTGKLPNADAHVRDYLVAKALREKEAAEEVPAFLRRDFDRETPVVAATTPGLTRLLKSERAPALRDEVLEEQRKALIAAANRRPAKAPKATPVKTDVAAAPRRLTSGTVSVLVANPKRPGTRAHAAFSCYRDGQTVAEFIAACAAGNIPEQEARANLSWDRRKGFISITEEVAAS
jgi:hypothetical protein